MQAARRVVGLAAAKRNTTRGWLEAKYAREVLEMEASAR
jgi:hypothetical protein